jgi:hypothetical protein
MFVCLFVSPPRRLTSPPTYLPDKKTLYCYYAHPHACNKTRTKPTFLKIKTILSCPGYHTLFLSYSLFVCVCMLLCGYVFFWRQEITYTRVTALPPHRPRFMILLHPSYNLLPLIRMNIYVPALPSPTTSRFFFFHFVVLEPNSKTLLARAETASVPIRNSGGKKWNLSLNYIADRLFSCACCCRLILDVFFSHALFFFFVMCFFALLVRCLGDAEKFTAKKYDFVIIYFCLEWWYCRSCPPPSVAWVGHELLTFQSHHHDVNSGFDYFKKKCC